VLLNEEADKTLLLSNLQIVLCMSLVRYEWQSKVLWAVF